MICEVNSASSKMIMWTICKPSSRLMHFKFLLGVSDGWLHGDCRFLDGHFERQCGDRKDHRPSAKCCHGDSTQCPWPPQGMPDDIRFV